MNANIDVFNTYNGGKNGAGTYQQIINRIPYHDIYIEGFLGSGAIFKNKSMANNNILIDKDHNIINVWLQNYEGNKDIFHVLDTIHFIENAYPLLNMLHKLGFKIFIYLDPPYPFFTRRSSKKVYRFEMTDKQHIQLLNAINNLNCFVMISSYKNEMYDKHLSTWLTHEFEAQTRVGTATEYIYYNYSEPELLHDYRYIGNDFRERERIKGIKKRNIKKFKRMPPIERNNILKDLLPLIPVDILKNYDASGNKANKF